jgi:hypothetical protein
VTTAYHPQGDGQTKHVNQELEQYLWLFVNEQQDDYKELLPLAEFQYNNHVHLATKQTPFMPVSGRHPWMGFEPQQAESQTKTVNKFKDQMEKSLEESKAALTKSKEDMACYYDQQRMPAPEYHAGDKVFLDASDIKTTCPLPKLTHSYLSPYLIQRKVGWNAYWLQLPQSMKRLHPVFNVVKLLQATEDPTPGQRVW